MLVGYCQRQNKNKKKEGKKKKKSVAVTGYLCNKKLCFKIPYLCIFVALRFG